MSGIDTAGSDFDTALAVYVIDYADPSPPGGLAFVACNDDNSSIERRYFWLNHAIQPAFCEIDMESSKDRGLASAESGAIVQPRQAG